MPGMSHLPAVPSNKIQNLLRSSTVYVGGLTHVSEKHTVPFFSANQYSEQRNVLYQKNKNFISTAVSTSTLANPTLTSRSTLRSTYQSRRPWFRSQESTCGIFV